MTAKTFWEARILVGTITLVICIFLGYTTVTSVTSPKTVSNTSNPEPIPSPTGSEALISEFPMSSLSSVSEPEAAQTLQGASIIRLHENGFQIEELTLPPGRNVLVVQSDVNAEIALSLKKASGEVLKTWSLHPAVPSWWGVIPFVPGEYQIVSTSHPRFTCVIQVN